MSQLEELRKELAEALKRVETLERANNFLLEENELLRRKLDATESQGTTAPFRREPRRRKKRSKPPGRSEGHSPAGRSLPTGPFEEEHTAKSPCACPECGSEKLTTAQPVDEYIEELPKATPQTIRIRNWHAECRDCGEQIVSPHPLSPTNGRPGAVRTRLGKRARATAAALTRSGMSMRKAAKVLHQTTGLKVSPGGLAQSNHRLAKSLTPTYHSLLHEVRSAPATHADETGWWMHGEPQMLLVFCSREATYYRVSPTRNRALVREVLGEDFDGVLVSDCLSIYDHVNPVQQKCYAHHLRAICKELEETPCSSLLKDLKELLLEAMALGRKKRRGKVWERKREDLQREAGRLLFQTRCAPGSEKRVRKRLAKQYRHLFTFLDYPGVDPTNNLAERQLRPAVITRKLSAGNKTEKGAHTWAILSSIAASAEQCGQPIVDAFLKKIP